MFTLYMQREVGGLKSQVLNSYLGWGLEHDGVSGN